MIDPVVALARLAVELVAFVAELLAKAAPLVVAGVLLLAGDLLRHPLD